MSTIIISLVMIAISLTLLLIFFTFNKNEKVLERLTLKADNLSLKVGQTVTNFYHVSSDKAVVTFDIENPNIVSINGKNLSALDVGKTNIKITASLDDVSTIADIVVEISANSFTLKITPSQNCYYENNTLYQTENFCRFSADILDYNGKLVEEFYYFSTNSSLLNKEFLYFELYSTKDCQIIFYIPAQEIYLELNVVYIKNLL